MIIRTSIRKSTRALKIYLSFLIITNFIYLHQMIKKCFTESKSVTSTDIWGYNVKVLSINM